MVVTTILVTRHGVWKHNSTLSLAIADIPGIQFRGNFTVDPNTGKYHTTVPSPTNVSLRHINLHFC